MPPAVQRTKIATDAVAAPTGVWSQAIRVETPRDLVFVSGITSRTADGEVFGVGDITLQTERVLESLAATLAAAGSSIADVVKLTVFVRDIDDFAAIHAVRRRFFSEPYPASSMVEISRLVDERSLIEIEAVAAPTGR